MWELGNAYDRYVGRWSRVVAPEFVRWLDQPAGLRWLDVGCGTGALTEAVNDPALVVGVDRSEGFLRGARVAVGDARELPVGDARFDVLVSGLALNFVPSPSSAVAEFARVVRPRGTVAAYVWDYADGMQMMRLFWDAAVAVDPGAVEFDEGRTFPMCSPDGLRSLWAGFENVTTAGIEIPTVFADFDDFWEPFLGRTGAAPAYLATLPDDQVAELRERLRAQLPDGPIPLTARVWAVRGQRPGS